jgi:hypothetical protein
MAEATAAQATAAQATAAQATAAAQEEPMSHSFSKSERDAFHYGMNLAEYLATIQQEWIVAKRKGLGEIHTILHREFVGDIKVYLEGEIGAKVFWEAVPSGAGLESPEDYRVVHIVG